MHNAYKTQKHSQADLLPGFTLTLMTICLWMKLVSYAHCHADLRAAHRQVRVLCVLLTRVNMYVCGGV